MWFPLSDFLTVIHELETQLLDIPGPPYLLSDSFDNLISFFGLSMDSFHWATSCKYFDSQTRGEKICDTLSSFIGWRSPVRIAKRYAKAREDALLFFGKQEAFDAFISASL